MEEMTKLTPFAETNLGSEGIGAADLKFPKYKLHVRSGTSKPQAALES
jgi:hypothetical protein